MAKLGTRLGWNRTWRGAATPANGGEALEAAPRERYCATCGLDASWNGPALERFGEAFCSAAHAEAFVEAVRAARVQAVATAPAASEGSPSSGAGPAPARPGWIASVGRALCWGVPLLAIVIFLSGGSTLLGAASGLLPVLAVLACPLGMFLMMRAMAKMGDSKDRDPGDRK